MPAERMCFPNIQLIMHEGLSNPLHDRELLYYPNLRLFLNISLSWAFGGIDDG